MKRFCVLFGKLLSVLIPRKLVRTVGSIHRYIYTGYYARYFKCFGTGSSFEPKCVLSGLQNISIGSECHFQRGLRLSALSDYGGEHFNSEIVIGDNASIGPNSHITCAKRIIIGKNLLTGGGILITDNSHGDTTFSSLQIGPDFRPIKVKGSVMIGDNVWLGDNVCILPGVSIGDGAIIGSNAVVTKDIPSYSVAVGNPARIVKTITG